MSRLEQLRVALEQAQRKGAFTLEEARAVIQNFELVVKEQEVLTKLVEQYEEENHDKKESELSKAE